MYLTPEQFTTLMRPLNTTRVAKRSQGGKQLSYLEAWDVKAHLTRIFGFGNWDAEIIREQFLGTHPYSGKDAKAMVEVMWQVTLKLTIRTNDPSTGWTADTVYSEAAVGSATGGAESSGIGDLHDNAIKQAASDALKRCAINLGTQFGLSLYDSGSTREVIKKVLVGEPEGVKPAVDPAKQDALFKAVGAQPDPSTTEAQASDGTAEDISKAQNEGMVQMLQDKLGATPVEEEPVAPPTGEKAGA